MTSHAHNFNTTITTAAIASAMAGQINNADAGYTAVYDENQDTFTVTADTPKDGEIITVQMLEANDDLRDQKALLAETYDSVTALGGTNSARDEAVKAYEDFMADADAKGQMDYASLISQLNTSVEPGKIAEDEECVLEGTGTVSISLESAPEEWQKAITSVSVQEITENEDETTPVHSYSPEEAGLEFGTSWGSSVLNLNSAIFNSENKRTSFNITLKAEGYVDSSAEISVINYSAESFQIRIVGKDGKVYPIKTYSKEEIEAMATTGHYQTACGMAGVRTFYAEGVLLTDLLEDAGVDFGPGMSIQLRTNDMATENDSTTEDAYYSRGLWTYEQLMGDRYYFPGIFGNEDFADAVENQTDGRWGETVRTALGATEDKVKVTPMICSDYIETIYTDDPTAAEPNQDDLDALNGINSEERAFRFLYGLAMDSENPDVVSGETTTWSATYGAFGIDIINEDYIGNDKQSGEIEKDSSAVLDGSGRVALSLESGDQDWVNAITSVTIQEEGQDAKTYSAQEADVKLESGMWGDEISFDSSIFDSANKRTTYNITIEATGYTNSTATVSVNNYSAESFQIRIVGKDGKVYPIKTYSKEEIEAMATTGHYQTACGMAGVRTFYAEGVLLTDLLEDAGVDFGPGMSIQLRTNDMATENDSTTEDAYYSRGLWTYEQLMGDRYYFPGIFGNEDFADAVENQTDGRWGETVRTALGATEDKVKVTPMICSDYIETIYTDDPTAAEPNQDDLDALNGINSEERAFRFLYGLAMDSENPDVVSSETTTWSATYGAFGIDIIDENYTGNTGSGGSGGGGGGSAVTNYTVTFDSNGGSSVAKQTVASGKTVSEPADPTREGYVFDGWYTDEELTQAYDFSDKVTKSFTLYAKWNEEGTDPGEEPGTDPGTGDTPNFSDVSADSWYAEYVTYLAERGIVNGKTETTFEPNSQITRAEFIKIIAEVAGADVTGQTSSKFSDVASGAWYAPYVAWGVENGLINGVSDTQFDPNGNITRQDMATLISRYAEFAEFEIPQTEEPVTFSDASDIASYAQDAVTQMQRAGIINGRGDNTFAPQDNATRAEACKMLTILMQQMGR